jgi:hypothetical protein
VTRALIIASALLLAAKAFAHPAPSSILRLEFQTRSVNAEYWVPVSELEFARAADAGGDFPAYLLRHIGAETSTGTRWRVKLESVRETTYLDRPYLVAQLTLSPPAGAAPREFVLLDDAVTHEVRNHVVYVVENRGADSALLGALQYPVRRLAIAAR